MAKKKPIVKPAEQTASSELPVYLVAVQDLVPNSWNPNVVPQQIYQKIKAGIQKLRATGEHCPAIEVRPHASIAGKYEIIDGEHRWKIYKELSEQRIPIHVRHQNEAEARILTSSLNWNRGEPNAEEYAKLVQEITTYGMTLEEAAKYLPQDADTLRDYLIQASEDFDLDVSLASLYDTEDTEDTEDTPSPSPALSHRYAEENGMTTVSLRLPVDIAESLEAELHRLKTYLRKQGVSKGIDFLAVDAMVANSRNTPDSQIEGQNDSFTDFFNVEDDTDAND